MENDTINASVYELVQLMASLNDTRRAILLALAHIYPRSVSGVQLSRLIGYSDVIIELKTGAHEEWHWLQLAGYRECLDFPCQVGVVLVSAET